MSAETDQENAGLLICGGDDDGDRIANTEVPCNANAPSICVHHNDRTGVYMHKCMYSTHAVIFYFCGFVYIGQLS